MCTRCRSADVRRFEERSPAWLRAEGVRSVTVQCCAACGGVSFSGFHPRQVLSKRAQCHLRTLGRMLRFAVDLVDEDSSIIGVGAGQL
jgi:hypothetical protein